MVDPVITGALGWVLQRVLDKGLDRLFDGAAGGSGKPAPALPPAVPVVVAPRRHDLSAAGAHPTSDIDIAVRHRAFGGRVPVILTFQKAGTEVGAAIVPMVLGDIAHLTLRRDLYLITAMVVTYGTSAGAKPTLHGIGWVREWVADNEVRTLTIATRHPTEQLLDTLGLRSPAGDHPFVLAPTPAAAPTRPQPETPAVSAITRARLAVAEARAALDAPRGLGQAGLPAATRVPYARRPSSPKCRARTSLGRRCPLPAGSGGLCSPHLDEANNGRFVYDHVTGTRIEPG